MISTFVTLYSSAEVQSRRQLLQFERAFGHGSGSTYWQDIALGTLILSVVLWLLYASRSARNRDIVAFYYAAQLATLEQTMFGQPHETSYGAPEVKQVAKVGALNEESAAHQIAAGYSPGT